MKNLSEILDYIETLKDIDLFFIDLFCGAGGLSFGVEQAQVDGQPCAKSIVCVNHDTNAILSHYANMPNALHFIEDIRILELSPIVTVVKKIREVHPNAKIMLHASLECTNFSKAKGGQARDADSRTLAEHLFRYIDVIEPDYIQIENVEEFMAWGDMDENGRPISMDKGRIYQNWVNNIKQYGYDFEHRILNSADYGAYTSRKRLFGLFAKKGLPIAWPEPTHAKNDHQTLFGSLNKWKSVKDLIDFSDEGKSIFGRKKQLAEKSLTRYYAGLIKFVAGGKEEFEKRKQIMTGEVPAGETIQFLSKYYSGHPDSKNISIDGPAHTIKCKDNHALIRASFLSAYYGTGDNVSPVDGPCPTVSTKDRFSLVTTFFSNYYSGGGQHGNINDPCSTILSVPKQRVVSCLFIDMQYGNSRGVSIDEPAGAISTNPKHSLVTCNQWLMNTKFNNTGSSLNDPSPVITANRKWHYLVNPQYKSAGGDVDKPCFTLIARMDKMPPGLVSCKTDIQGEIPSFLKITENGVIYEMYSSDSPMTVKIKEFMALYGIVDIKMRMLKISELKLIMGFPEEYVLIGTQCQQKKYIGNAVETTQARVNTEALCAKLRKMRLNSVA